MQKDLIYDIGMFDGADSGYYLSRGYRVVGVEANPTTAAEIREKYRNEITLGRLTVLNCAISETPGPKTFWVCPKYPALSSFSEETAKSSEHEYQPITVPCVTFDQILKENGTPFYLKTDIEGHDHLCLAALDPQDAPDYVSFEFTRLDDLFLLATKGYNRFKCIRQDTLTQISPPTVDLTSIRQDTEEYIRTRFAKVPGVTTALSGAKSVARRVRDAVNGSTNGAASGFPVGATGPFGEESHGPWRTLEEVCYAWLHFTIKYRGGSGMWADIHAKRVSE